MNLNDDATSMQSPRIEKVVINMSVGKSGEPLQKAMSVLELLTGQKPCQRIAKQTIREWGIRKNEPIACVATLRGEKAFEFLRKSLDARGNRLSRSSFDLNGNFSFGIKEHIEIRGVRYDPSIGIFGMDVCVSLGKPGYRVKRRRINNARVGKKQQLTPDEAAKYVAETFGIEVI